MLAYDAALVFPRLVTHQFVSFGFLTACALRKGGYYHPFFFFLFRAALRHTEVPRLGVQKELQLLAYTTATATGDQSHVFDPHHSLRQSWMLNPLSKARD